MGESLTEIRLTTDEQHDADCVNACIREIVSTRILKRMTGNSISNIFFERKLLPSTCFNTESVGMNQIKVLKKDTQHPYAVYTNKWLTGVLDAIDKNYVSKLTISIFEDDTLKNSIEKYTFSYKCLGNIKKVKSSPDSSLEVKVLYNKTIELFQSLLTTLSLLKPLPQKPVQVQVSINYNKSKPDYYIAPNFDECDNTADSSKNSLSINHVNLNTPFHRMTVYSNFDNIYHKYLTSQILPISDNSLQCFCKFSGEFCVPFLCSKCKKCSHSCCYGKIPDSEIRNSNGEKFEEVCIDCYFKNPAELVCTDMTLINFSKEKRKVISLIRRSLFFALLFNKFTYSDLSHYDGISKDDGPSVMNILNKFHIIDRKNDNFQINIESRDALVLKWFNVNSNHRFEVSLDEFDVSH